MIDLLIAIRHCEELGVTELSLFITGERYLPAVAVVARLETEDPGGGGADGGGGGGEPGEEALVPGPPHHAGGDGAGPAEPGQVVLHLVKQPDGPVLHGPALPGLVLTAGVAVERVGPHLGTGAGGQTEPGALSQLARAGPDCTLELRPPEAGGDTVRPGPDTALLVSTVALLPRLHQAVTALADWRPGDQTAALVLHHPPHPGRRAGRDPLVVPVDAAPAVAAHQEPPGALPGLGVVLGTQAVVNLVGQVQHSHPQGDPGHVPGPHGDEQTVEVQQLRPLLGAHIGAGLTDARLGGGGGPPGEAEDLPGELPAGEEDGQAVAVQLVLGEGLQVAGRGDGAGVGVQDVVVGGLGLDDPQPADVDTETVSTSVLVVVLLLHQLVELPGVVQHLQDTALH